MPTPVETLLTSFGIPAEDVTKITTLSEEDQKTFDAKPYAEKVKSNYQTQFKNDPEFFSGITIENLPPDVKKKIEGSQFARAANITRERLVKGLGLTDADLADLTEEQKKEFDQYVHAVVDKFTKTKTGAKEIQEQLIAERRKNEEYQTKFGPDYETGIKTKYETEANQKINSAIFNAALIGELSSIPGLKIPAADIAATANQILQSKYGFERVGDYTVELRQKANPQMKVLKENSSKELTLKEALTDIATERGWIEPKSDEGKGSGTVPVVPNNGKLTMVAPHIADKISQKMAKEKV